MQIQKGTPDMDDKTRERPSTDEHIGAVEGDRPSDTPQQGNPHGEALDENGLPNNPVAVCEDVIGANADKTEG